MMKITRRSILKVAATAAAALAAPPFVKNAFSSSGSVNFMGWAGYDYAPAFDAFKKATGITVNATQLPDQDSMFAQCKLALQTGGADFAEPTMDRAQSWVTNGLVQPWDDKKLAIADYIDGAPGVGDGSQGFVDGKRIFVPSSWGTEALVFNKKEAPLTYGVASLADLFDPKFEGKVTVRPHSALAALGRSMDAQHKLPKPFVDSYKDEATMRQVWDVVLAEAIKRKGTIGQFWTSENEAQGAMRTNGCVLGLCWDSTAAALAPDGVGYIAPKEGAFAWCQGFVVMKNATNVDQAHEWAKWISSAEGASAWATQYSCNPVGKGALEKMSPTVKEFYNSAFPGDAVSKNWWWPTQEAWFVKLRTEYADKWRAA